MRQAELFRGIEISQCTTASHSQGGDQVSGCPASRSAQIMHTLCSVPKGRSPPMPSLLKGRGGVERLATQSSRDMGLWRTGEHQEPHCTLDMICPDSPWPTLESRQITCLCSSAGMRVVTSQTSIVNPEMPYGEHQGLVSRAVFSRALSVPTSWFTVPLSTTRRPGLPPPLTLVHLLHL